MLEPWVVFEDDDVLAVVKPAGVATHRVGEHAQDGMYEWVRAQRPEKTLSILHRLDKATSGLLVFGSSRRANQSLAQQFEQRSVDKRYEFLTGARAGRRVDLLCTEPVDVGTSARPDRRTAATEFARRRVGAGVEQWDAHPRTGRTHQVRVHAADSGMPIMGDADHGGADAARLFLHAADLGFDRPTGDRLELSAPRPASFDRVLEGADPHGPTTASMAAHESRAVLFEPGHTDAYLWADRHLDGFADVRLERLGGVALVIRYDDRAGDLDPAWIDAWNDTVELDGIYEQRRPRRGQGGPPRRLSGSAPSRFDVRELGVRHLIDLDASPTSTGLFLDQRETRARLLGEDRSNTTVCNAFGHTGSLSVAAALAGAETLTLDLSKRYLDWARENLVANGIDPADHDFIYGDAQDWMDRLGRKGRRFDTVILDPPSSSTSKRRGRWVVDRDLHGLVERGARLCASDGTLVVSTNLRRMGWDRFLGQIGDGLAAAGRRGAIETRTVPLDHRTGPGDPPYLKAAWITLHD